jgi:hypothetical protein
MSLDYDLRNVVDRDTNYPPTSDGGMNLTTYALVWRTMSIGMHEITKDNVVEFYSRCHFVDLLLGPLVSKGDGTPVLITLDDVVGHIGLRTNAFTRETELQWRKRITGRILDDYRYQAKADLKAARSTKAVSSMSNAEGE